MEMKVSFPGNLRVDAEFGAFTVQTDQPGTAGGDDTAPAPFALFLASIATCAGIYVLAFLRQRGLETAGAGLTMRTSTDPETGLVGTIEMEVDLPPSFPEKYRDAVLRAVDQCTVKRHLARPPQFKVAARIAGAG
jgi:putative redox protein